MTLPIEKKSRTLDLRLVKRSNQKYARVVELVDTRDLKSLDRNIVPVQVRPRVPHGIMTMMISNDIILQFIIL